MDSQGQKKRTGFMPKLVMPNLGGFDRHAYDPDKTEIKDSYSPPTPDSNAAYHTWSAPSDRQYLSLFGVGLFTSLDDDRVSSLPSKPSDCPELYPSLRSNNASITSEESMDSTQSEPAGGSTLRRVATFGSLHPPPTDRSGSITPGSPAESDSLSRPGSVEPLEVRLPNSPPSLGFLKNNLAAMDRLDENPNSPDVGALDRPAFPKHADRFGGFEHNPISNMVKQNPQGFFHRPVKVSHEDILMMSMKF